MELPNSLESLNAATLTKALSARFPGTVVTHVVHGTVIHGTATKVRLLLEYNDAGHVHGLPATLWYKGGLEAHSLSEPMKAIYAAEAAFYRDVAPMLSMTLPKCYSVQTDPTTGHSAMLLEDMLVRNARFGHVTRPASPKLAANVLGQFARMHGAFWNSDALAANKALAAGGELLAGFVAAFNCAPENWARMLTLPRARFVTDELRDRGRISALIQRLLAEDRERYTSLVHGDAHLGNVCILPGDNACFLDFQTAMLGFWAHDVAYFLAGALTIADRRNHERGLIRHYVAELREAGGQLDEEQAWWEYRKHALYAFCWFGCPPEWVPEEMACLYTERAVAAVTDLDSLTCWSD
jgi:Phosphotransferase enzyme family